MLSFSKKDKQNLTSVLSFLLFSKEETKKGTRRAGSWAYRAISENMSRHKIAQQSLFLIVFKMAALLVKMHETVKDYIDSSENQPLATEIGSKLLQLSRAVIKKHTFDGERA